MAGCSSCASETDKPPVDRAYRRILWIALVINGAMCLIELAAGAVGRSLALTADAMDFFSDAANYAITLMVLAMPLRVRAKAAFFKGACMGLVGLYVLGISISHIINGTVPRYEVMGVIGTLALLANLGVAMMLFRHRKGDANRQSIWICSRNDAIANIGVLLASAGVWASTTGWPDILVGLIIAAIGLWGAFQIMARSLSELKSV